MYSKGNNGAWQNGQVESNESATRKDTNQVAFDIVNKIAKDPAAQSLGRRGGMARKAKLTQAN